MSYEIYRCGVDGEVLKTEPFGIGDFVALQKAEITGPTSVKFDTLGIGIKRVSADEIEYYRGPIDNLSYETYNGAEVNNIFFLNPHAPTSTRVLFNSKPAESLSGKL